MSVFGALGTQAQALLAAVGRRCGRSLPIGLLDEASWATPSFTPFARCVLTLEIRRSLAMAVGQSIGTEEFAASLRHRAPEEALGLDAPDADEE